MTEILIVDDELGIRNILTEILAESGYRVSAAANAAEARAAVADRRFDLVLLDIWMPDMDGLTLLREWRYSGLLTFPVIVMSGHGSLEHAKRALDDGAVDFIEKPISLKRLLTAIKDGIAKWEEHLRKLEEERLRDGRRSRRKGGGEEPRGIMPVFEIKEYGLILDFNRPFRDVLFEFERAYFRSVLTHLNHSMADLARHAGMERTHLYRKIRSLGIDVEAMRAEARRGAPIQAALETALSTAGGAALDLDEDFSEASDAPKAAEVNAQNAVEFPTGSTLDDLQPSAT